MKSTLLAFAALCVLVGCTACAGSNPNSGACVRQAVTNDIIPSNTMPMLGGSLGNVPSTGTNRLTQLSNSFYQ